ncbi:MAG: ROK family protein [Actinomycetota bacterium]
MTEPGAETPATVAIDLGGTNVRAAVVAADGTVVARAQRPTPPDDPQPTALVELVTEVCATAGDAPVAGAVVGVPGIVDHDENALDRAPNLPQAWIPWLRGSWLGEHMGLDVSLANDADLAAVGESAFGAGRRFRDVAYVTISTGVGAGVVVGGRLVRGRNSGGEIGHTVIDHRAALAGRPSTVEELGAGPAIAAAAASAGIAERDAALADLVRSGHPAATEVWNAAIEAVGIGITNLAWLVSPQVVVIGGGVGRNIDIVAPPIERILAARGPATDTPIQVAVVELGDDAALAGAAAWFDAIAAGPQIGLTDDRAGGAAALVGSQG